MNLVIFTHPPFLSSQSMPKYVQMLAKGMRMRGHKVELWRPKSRFFLLPLPKSMRKWMGYLDQYILFPIEISRRIKTCSRDTLFVFADQSLGLWVPQVATLPHIIHCHDFLAQKSALGEIPEHATGWTGKQYQRLIRRGFSRGKHFISVSENTREDLHRFLPSPSLSEVIYNGLNQPFGLQDVEYARNILAQKTCLDLSKGYVLHVGGNQWYKNRIGVIEIYNAWRFNSSAKLPLIMIGASPSRDLLRTYSQSSFKDDIHLLSGIDDELVRMAYSGASVLLFPSLSEGFGWPIAEAMASGCPVITTNEAPMTEVAGGAGFLISRRPNCEAAVTSWARGAADVLNKVVELSSEDRREVVNAGLRNVKRFQSEVAISNIEMIYKKVLQKYYSDENSPCYC
ncbi:glycosyltransferase family 4 protein [Chitinophagaceae bacterium LB-8]|uniref:Glycosyltransferase family 4 protein n=1 Tax=Paraflavisolibacter caeni TaxID=2982496 RepID=A0A9X2XSM6_9BACT|nr:glycosyltransferase family 1 protein [Paraflavisolibacter caeni]MCU7547501.1 glycosyltransferase family 4 protein [Paraflavisolibacter caeni]